MKLDCILTAVNENKLYIDFVPFFIRTWNKLYPEVDVKIILIANEIPYNLNDCKDNIILFKPIENVSTSFTSQYIRLLYPAILNYKNGVMITDIDMVPMNRTYYTENIVSFTEDRFIYYRENICFNAKQIAMCYNVASSKIWSDIFKIESIQDIVDRLKNVYKNINYMEGHGKSGWGTDQIDLYKYVMEWNKKTNNFICLKEIDTKFNRLDRDTFDINNQTIKNNISNCTYTDYHCFRPMNKYVEINNCVYDLL
jgi:hypothetical protein